MRRRYARRALERAIGGHATGVERPPASLWRNGTSPDQAVEKRRLRRWDSSFVVAEYRMYA